MTNFPEVKGSDNLQSAILAAVSIRAGKQPLNGFDFRRPKIKLIT